MFPALGAYVGPDIVAGILATGITLDRRVRLFIDVGTNSEIVLGSSAKTLATAAPAGPAFEAAQIRCGMRAAEGAIEGVKIVDGDVQLTVIGDVAAVGLCGSGLVDAVAELDRRRHARPFRPLRARAHRIVSAKIGEENVFYLSDDVYLSQRDVRELQFAKASIATGWGILCRDLGVEPEEISQVLLGGSFGSYLSAASAVKIGLVPKLPLARIVSAGNVAGEGAKIAALSVTERAAANAILEEVEYVELSGRTDFNDLFIDQLSFPGMSTGRRRLRRARAPREEDRRAPRLGPRGAPGAARAAQPPREDPRRGRRRPRTATTSSSRTHTAAPNLDGYAKLPGAHCYEVYGAEHEPATYFLTDFLVRSFDNVVWRGLGLDRYPGAPRRLLRELRARRLARARTGQRAPRAGRGGRAKAGPAARSTRDWRHRARTRPGATTGGRHEC